MQSERVELSPDQEYVKRALLEFVNSAQAAYITFGGYAGTGKTTIIGELARDLEECKIAFCAYTGKAASVLATKLDRFDYCGTIHSLIYRPILGEKKRIIEWELRDRIENFDLIVIDEASMVNEVIFEDLCSLGVPIIAVGDHGQLPPVKSMFNLMSKPQLKLEKIHRQAENNLIIKLSAMARKDGVIPFGEFGPGVRKVKGLENLNNIQLDDVLCLCGTNRMRQNINQLAVGKRNPKAGDKVICLKNNRRKGIYNGMIGNITEIEDAPPLFWNIEVDFEQGDSFSGNVFKQQFGNPKTIHDTHATNRAAELFDWAYCLTVHKAQGSEADSVVLIEENLPFLSEDDWKRWLYTGITRARKELLIIKP